MENNKRIGQNEGLQSRSYNECRDCLLKVDLGTELLLCLMHSWVICLPEVIYRKIILT